MKTEKEKSKEMYKFCKTLYRRLKEAQERAGGSSSYGDTFYVMYDNKRTIGETLKELIKKPSRNSI